MSTQQTPVRRVTRVTTTRIPTQHADFIAHAYRDELTGEDHVVLVLGDLDDPALALPSSDFIRSASPPNPSARAAATAVNSSKPPKRPSQPKAAGSSSTCAVTKDAESAWPQSFAPTRFKTTAWTPSMRISRWDCLSMPASTVLPPRSCLTLVCTRCA